MDRAFSLSGAWTGRYDYDGAGFGPPVSFEATLLETAGVLSGEIIEPNSFREELSETLLSVISGTRQSASVRFVKTYTDFDETGHPLYKGVVNARATRINGTWWFPTRPTVCGTFLMVRRTDAVEREIDRSETVDAMQEADT